MDTLGPLDDRRRGKPFPDWEPLIGTTTSPRWETPQQFPTNLEPRSHLGLIGTQQQPEEEEEEEEAEEEEGAEAEE